MSLELQALVKQIMHSEPDDFVARASSAVSARSASTLPQREVLLDYFGKESPGVFHIFAVLIAEVLEHEGFFEADARGDFQGCHTEPGETDQPVG